MNHVNIFFFYRKFIDEKFDKFFYTCWCSIFIMVTCKYKSDISYEPRWELVKVC